MMSLRATKLFVAIACMAAFFSAGTALSAESETTVSQGMVSSAYELASQAGDEIMKRGGNAVDAAVATSLALSVVEHHFSGIGGGGFALIRLAKTEEVVFVDYRETAPAAVKKDMFEDAKIKDVRARFTGIPGYLKGMFHMLGKYGTMTFAEVAQPAIRLAEEGWTVAPNQFQWYEEMYLPFAGKYDKSSNPFMKSGYPYKVGERMKLPKLAKTYRLIGQKGLAVFYEGEIAKAMVKEINRLGGAVKLEDFKNYRLEERKPFTGEYRGYKILSSPPASGSGAQIIQTLNLMENFPSSSWKFDNPERRHVLAEAFRLVFADRDKYMADTDFHSVPLAGLTNKKYASKLAERIKMRTTMEKAAPGNPWEYEGGSDASDGTAAPMSFGATATHFSVADTDGNMVVCTNSHNYPVGFVPGYDFLLGDGLVDFAKVSTSRNAAEPGKRPLSSLSPTIVLDPKGRPFMALSSAGGWRVITAVSQVIMNVIDYGMAMDGAINAERIFTYTMNGQPAKLLIEGPVSEAQEKEYKEMKEEPEVRGKSDYFGTVQGILYRDSKLNGSTDARHLGAAAGF